MSDEEFEERTGLKVPRGYEGIGQSTQSILDGMALMTPERREAFVKTLSPEQRKLLDITEMPELSKAETEAINEWLDKA